MNKIECQRCKGLLNPIEMDRGHFIWEDNTQTCIWYCWLCCVRLECEIRRDYENR